ncbi:hypothetical protein FB45DRAFT_53207 [Roridomyces roridus]|uniref:Uncharacterized protein n=1 Tax=Roridomyces roridus TaxID=1738132 RepID=A0AAD7AYH2_9AGAR|nr:hypothetical protein FB45DRAFT_53207 [Roridomyces roridus]
MDGAWEACGLVLRDNCLQPLAKRLVALSYLNVILPGPGSAILSSIHSIHSATLQRRRCTYVRLSLSGTFLFSTALLTMDNSPPPLPHPSLSTILLPATVSAGSRPHPTAPDAVPDWSHFHRASIRPGPYVSFRVVPAFASPSLPRSDIYSARRFTPGHRPVSFCLPIYSRRCDRGAARRPASVKFLTRRRGLAMRGIPLSRPLACCLVGLGVGRVAGGSRGLGVGLQSSGPWSWSMGHLVGRQSRLSQEGARYHQSVVDLADILSRKGVGRLELLPSTNGDDASTLVVSAMLHLPAEGAISGDGTVGCLGGASQSLLGARRFSIRGKRCHTFCAWTRRASFGYHTQLVWEPGLSQRHIESFGVYARMRDLLRTALSRVAGRQGSMILGVALQSPTRIRQGP